MKRDDLPPQITYGSVCSGIEAATVAWRPLGWHAAWFAEIEPYPCAVLAHHYPDVPNLGDMTKIAQMIRDGFASAPDILCGGTPCQAFSIAGLRNSLDDARGNLSLVFCEIADEIDKRRAADGLLPAIIVWENVPGVLSTKDNAFGCFLAGLAGEDDPIIAPGGKWPNAGCVYGPKRTVAWRVLDAQYFGVAQRRRRVFVVASAREGFDPAEVLFEFDGVRRDSPPSREAGQEIAGTVRASAARRGGVQDECGLGLQPVGHRDLAGRGTAGGLICASNAEGSTGLPFLTCSNIAKTVNNQTPLLAFEEVAAPVTRSVERPRGDGLDTLIAQSPPCNARLGGDGCLTPWDSQQKRIYSASADYAPTLSGSDGGGGRYPPAIAFDAPIAFSVKDHGGDAAVDLAPTLRAGNHSTSHANGGNPPAIAFSAVDYKEGTYEEVDAARALTTSADRSRAAPIVAFQDRFRGDDGRGYDRAPPMSVEQVGTLETVKQWHVATSMAVRRLTPRECERLQAFPDDYTLIPYGRVIKMEKLEQDWIKYLLRGGVMTLEEVCQAAADGPRYKALGNSWCVYNVRWLGRRVHFALTGSWPECGNFAHEREMGLVAM